MAEPLSASFFNGCSLESVNISSPFVATSDGTKQQEASRDPIADNLLAEILPNPQPKPAETRQRALPGPQTTGQGPYIPGLLVQQTNALFMQGRIADAVAVAETATDAAVLTGGSLQQVVEHGDVEILILGLGRRMATISRELRAVMRQAGIVLEAMDTGAACRTYNMLMAEDRRLAAALIPPV